MQLDRRGVGVSHQKFALRACVRLRDRAPLTGIGLELLPTDVTRSRAGGRSRGRPRKRAPSRSSQRSVETFFRGDALGKTSASERSRPGRPGRSMSGVSLSRSAQHPAAPQSDRRAPGRSWRPLQGDGTSGSTRDLRIRNLDRCGCSPKPLRKLIRTTQQEDFAWTTSRRASRSSASGRRLRP